MPAPPSDLVLVGRITGAFGVRGQLKIAPESSPQQSALKGQKLLWLGNEPAQCTPVTVKQLRAAHDSFLLTVADITNRDDALAFGKPGVWVSRAQFPPTKSGEYYWSDLIGCTVVNREGQELGQVVLVDDHGAHALLHLQGPYRDLIIPFVEQYVDSVELSARHIRVDWPLTFLED
jgi:16S rRNA processing protein RimM